MNEPATSAAPGALAAVYGNITAATDGLTRGHALRTADFITTLTAEAAVHYLGLAVQLSAAGWTDRDYILKGTGRVPLDGDDRGALGRWPASSRSSGSRPGRRGRA
jgi:hypothetical protein